MPLLSFMLARFSEPSSYAGLGAVLALAGIHFSDTVFGQLVQFLAAGCGLAALFLKERGFIQMFVLAALVGAALGACTPSETQTVLTATEQAMCSAQSAANLAGAVAAAAGDATAAVDASKASTAAGVGCTWANSPAAGAPAAVPQ